MTVHDLSAFAPSGPTSVADSVEALREEMTSEWSRLLEGSDLAALVHGGEIDRRLYALYLIETFHYTRENPRHQALVGARTDTDPMYARFCLKHASEELGHEMMALHDLRSLGYDVTAEDLPSPLEETEVLTAYLYWISQRANPLGRVGYSFWAESSYEHIGPLLAAAQTTLDLEDRHMTFLVAHAKIDADHAAEVDQVLRRFATTTEDWVAIGRVMRTSLRLTVEMLDAVAREYRAVAEGLSDRTAPLGI
jgi:pyrroloquinoline quinone (PQQ) biosynthesis protein C